MEEFHVTERDLAKMERIGTVSSQQPGKERWTQLGLYFRHGFKRPFVAVAMGVGLTGTFSFKFMAAGSVDRALNWLDDSELTDTLRIQAEDWTGPKVASHARRDGKMIEALRAIADGEGDAQVIALQTLESCSIPSLEELRKSEFRQGSAKA